MGTSSSKSETAGGSRFLARGNTFQAIADKFHTLDEVVAALRTNGLESSNLIVAVDYTKSNEWTGKYSFGGRCLHAIGPELNPYEHAIAIIAKTLRNFDDDGLIPALGFGDATTQDAAVFNFFPNDAPCRGLDELTARYRELTPYVKLSGPTSFAPAIYQAMKLVVQSGCQFHILVIVADGQVTRPSDMSNKALSRQEQATVDAIVAASQLPLSIVLVGVGDGPWDVMREFDDKLPARRWDNFQFVNFTEVAQRFHGNPQQLETTFAVRALMEIPDQFKLIQRYGLLGSNVRLQSNIRCLPPPAPTSIGSHQHPPAAPYGQAPAPGVPAMAGAGPSWSPPSGHFPSGGASGHFPPGGAGGLPPLAAGAYGAGMAPSSGSMGYMQGPSAGGYPQGAAPGSYPQGPPGGYPQGPSGSYPQAPPGGYPQGSAASPYPNLYTAPVAPNASQPQGADARGASTGPLDRADSSDSIDPLFVCPITQEIMKDPVVAADGYTYDRPSIAKWLENHDTSPMSNAPLAHKNLTANHALRSSITTYLEKQSKGGML